ncbi:uncharacterized protein LOC114521720 [Dendronephthya gigantea]|uniref:uncharacterized protein LOC114521720 n=1 Tax=Dendronephthya gigantea TaxID=151771 RepID=UPI00106D9C9E|nr:uncharacterized protein LOC114521720 [Dendronephthya gigantea]
MRSNSNLRSRFHLLIGIVGTIVFCSGIFILASGIVVRDLLWNKLTHVYDVGHITCQYWAGIPTILTGSILVLAVVCRHQVLKYVSVCAVLITMVLTLGVIMEESAKASAVHYHSRDGFLCKEWLERQYNEKRLHELKADCLKFKEAAPWYYIMVFAADIVFVLCSFVALILFSDWFLFVAPRSSYYSSELAHNLPPAYQTGCYNMQHLSNTQQDPNPI